MSSTARTPPKPKSPARRAPTASPLETVETEAQKLSRARKMLDDLMKESQALAIRAGETAAKLS